MDNSSRLVHATLAFSVAAVIGCGSSTSAPQSGGSIALTITPAGNGSGVNVGVSSPNGYNVTITGTGTVTLSDLAQGTYTIVADSTFGMDSVIGFNIDTAHVTGSPTLVIPGGHPVATVAYAVKERFGGMWVANSSYGTSPEFASSQLGTTGSPVPAETLAAPISHPAGLALDGGNNMWESSSSSDTLLMYSPAARNAGGGTPPTTVLVSSALENAQNLAFDGQGNLWVANCGGGNILEYTPVQQSAGGDQAPTITLTSATLACPYSLAIDTGGTGNVWVADHGNNHVVEFSAAQLAVGGTVVPIDTIGSNSGALHSPDAIVLDGEGNMWVANDGLSTVVGYSRFQVFAGGAPAPQVTITLPATADPFGLTLDQSNALWVSDRNNGIMYRLTQAQLAASGAPTPAVALTVSLGHGFRPEQPAFDYTATALSAARARLHPVTPAAHTIRRHSN